MPSAQFSDFLKKTLSRNEIDPLHQKIFNENLIAAAKKLPNVLDGEDYVSINTVREDDETQLSTITLVATDRPFLIDSFSAIVHAAGLRMKNLFHQSFFMMKINYLMNLEIIITIVLKNTLQNMHLLPISSFCF